LLTSADDRYLCGHFHVLAFKSAKSKRVATSTAHAETLILMSGIEESLFMQTWLYEMRFPSISSREMLKVPGKDHIPIIAVTDCNDVLESLIKTAVPTPVNRALTLYQHALRELYQLGFVRAYVWIDTRCNFSNSLTKLKPDGLLELDGLQQFYRCAGWEPTMPYRWHSNHLTDPETYTLSIIAPPPPPTKVMEDQKLKAAEEEARSNMLPDLHFR